MVNRFYKPKSLYNDPFGESIVRANKYQTRLPPATVAEMASAHRGSGSLAACPRARIAHPLNREDVNSTV